METKMETRHTPGPWQVDANVVRDGYRFAVAQVALIEALDAARLAGIHQHPDTADDLPWYVRGRDAIALATQPA